MAMTFATSVAVNNILALRSFYTFLFNYELHDKPSFVEKLILPRLKKWVADKGWMNMCELLREPAHVGASVTLNDVAGDFFAVRGPLHGLRHFGDWDYTPVPALAKIWRAEFEQRWGGDS